MIRPKVLTVTANSKQIHTVSYSLKIQPLLSILYYFVTSKQIGNNAYQDPCMIIVGQSDHWSILSHDLRIQCQDMFLYDGLRLKYVQGFWMERKIYIQKSEESIILLNELIWIFQILSFLQFLYACYLFVMCAYVLGNILKFCNQELVTLLSC